MSRKRKEENRGKKKMMKMTEKIKERIKKKQKTQRIERKGVEKN